MFSCCQLVIYVTCYSWQVLSISRSVLFSLFSPSRLISAGVQSILLCGYTLTVKCLHGNYASATQVFVLCSFAGMCIISIHELLIRHRDRTCLRFGPGCACRCVPQTDNQTEHHGLFLHNDAGCHVALFTCVCVHLHSVIVTLLTASQSLA